MEFNMNFLKKHINKGMFIYDFQALKNECTISLQQKKNIFI